MSTFYVDIDGDGYGDPNTSQQMCFGNEAWVEDNTDCNDTDFETHPGHAETCNLADDDCDGEVDEDATNTSTFYQDLDLDGYGDPAAPVQKCFPGDGWSENSMDCDDTSAAVNPGATDIPDDGVDQDCDGIDATSGGGGDITSGGGDAGPTDPDSGVGGGAGGDTGPVPDTGVEPGEDSAGGSGLGNGPEGVDFSPSDVHGGGGGGSAPSSGGGCQGSGDGHPLLPLLSLLGLLAMGRRERQAA